MAEFSGIGGMIDGLQQGYTFAKDAMRKNDDDAFKKKERERDEKKWGHEDDREAKIAALNKEFFPPEAKAPPAPGLGIPALAASTVAVPDNPAPSEPPLTPATTDTPRESTLADQGPSGASVEAPAPQAAAVSPPAVGIASGSPVQPAAGRGLPQPGATSPGAAQAGLPVQPNQMRSMNQSLDYLMRRAEIDMQAPDGKGDGVINLHRLQETNRKEGLTKAIQMLQNGDNEGAMRAYNETGESKGWQVQSATDGVFKHGGAEIPTKMVTVKNADGTVRTINTAQAMIQTQKIDELITQAQKGVEIDDKRTDALAGRGIQQQNADTQEKYRRDQAENMKAQRRLQEAAIDAKAADVGTAPIWDDKADTFLKQRYTAADPGTGVVAVDGDGIQFGKAVALSRARANGGDTTTGLGYAFEVDTRLKASAGQDTAKLRQLRNQYLNSISSPASKPATAQGTSLSAEWEAVNAASKAGAPAREATRRELLMQELAAEKDPENMARLKREISRLPPEQQQPGAVLTPDAARRIKLGETTKGIAAAQKYRMSLDGRSIHAGDQPPNVSEGALRYRKATKDALTAEDISQFTKY